MKVNQQTEQKRQQEAFDGVSIVKSKRYLQYASLLDSVLEPDKLYSHDDVQKILEEVLTQPVETVVND